MIRRLVILSAVMALGAAIFAPASQANLAITKWQALTCKENKDLPATPPYAVPEVGYESALPRDRPEQCTSATERQMVHPGGRPSELRDHRLQAGHGSRIPRLKPEASRSASSKRSSSTRRKASASTRRPRPSARSRCWCSTNVRTASQVGTNYLTVAAQSPNGAGVCLPAGECLQARVALPVYNLVPFDGVPSMVGFLTEGGPTFIVGSLDPVDQHVIFTIDIHAPSADQPADHRVAAGLQRAGRQRHLPDDAEQLRRRSDDPAAPPRAGRHPAVRTDPERSERLVHDRGRRVGLRHWFRSNRRSTSRPAVARSTRPRRPPSTSGSRSTRTNRSPTRT